MHLNSKAYAEYTFQLTRHYPVHVDATKQRLLARRDNYAKRSTFVYPSDVQACTRQTDGTYHIAGALDGYVVRFVDYADRCEDVGRAVDHSGWYTDADYQSEVMRGAVFMLPHGRYLAGYVHGESMRSGFAEVSGTNGATIDFRTYHETARDAAIDADEMARIVAEHECEYQAQERIRYEREEREAELADAHADSDLND